MYLSALIPSRTPAYTPDALCHGLQSAASRCPPSVIPVTRGKLHHSALRHKQFWSPLAFQVAVLCPPQITGISKLPSFILLGVHVLPTTLVIHFSASRAIPSAVEAAESIRVTHVGTMFIPRVPTIFAWLHSVSLSSSMIS